MKDRLEAIEARYNQITEALSDINIVSNIKRMTELSKEQRSIEDTVNKYREFKALEKTIEDLEILSHDSDVEMRELAMSELEEAREKIANVEEELKVLLIPKDPNDDKNVIVEIREIGRAHV